MAEKLCFLIFTLTLCIFLGGCPGGPVYEDDLGDGYIVIATDVMQDAAIAKKQHSGSGGLSIQLVTSSVFAYGRKGDFIIAKQHPWKDWPYGKADTSLTNWYIVEVASGNVHGPLSENEFQMLRNKLNLPEEISLKTIQ